MRPGAWLLAAWCRRFGHQWFPGNGQREFIPLEERCLRCNESRVLMPYGRCLGGHELIDHYQPGSTSPYPYENCPGPH